MPKSLPKYAFLSVMLICCTVYACLSHDAGAMVIGLIITGIVALFD